MIKLNEIEITNESIKMKVTFRQAQIYFFIKGFIEDKGFPPTMKDIAKGFHFKSDNSAVDHLRALQKKGWLIRENGLSRSIKLLSK